MVVIKDKFGQGISIPNKKLIEVISPPKNKLTESIKNYNPPKSKSKGTYEPSSGTYTDSSGQKFSTPTAPEGSTIVKDIPKEKTSLISPALQDKPKENIIYSKPEVVRTERQGNQIVNYYNQKTMGVESAYFQQSFKYEDYKNKVNTLPK